jgi:hypothetical protein
MHVDRSIEMDAAHADAVQACAARTRTQIIEDQLRVPLLHDSIYTWLTIISYITYIITFSVFSNI